MLILSTRNLIIKSIILTLWIFVENAEPQNTTLEGLSVRLTSGRKLGEGRVEIRYNSSMAWGTICRDYWDDVDATVLCRMLGYRWGSTIRVVKGSGPIYMDNVQCRGNETVLTMCAYNGWGKHNCHHAEDIGVRCFNHSVKLVSSGSNVNSGAVEVRELTGWVPVCDSQWDDQDAKVVCRGLGFKFGKAFCCSKLSYIYRLSRMRKSYNEFKCSGKEDRLSNCSHTISNNAKCLIGDHRASVVCYNTTPQLAYTMRIGSNESVNNSTWGTIQVLHSGIWGISCAKNFNDTVANIACKEMGHGGGIQYGSDIQYIHLPSWISGYNCNGTESSLQECVVEPWGQPVRTCNPNAVLCFQQGSYSVSLVGGGADYGRVEITVDDETGSICDNRWSKNDAKVVCKHLGYVDGTAYRGSYHGSGNGSVFIDGVTCRGNEESILACMNKGWKRISPACQNHSKDASVVCHKEVKLTKGGQNHGVVMIRKRRYSYNYWTPLCGNGFSDVDAKVVCMELGFEKGRALALGAFGTYYSYRGYARNEISCNGSEKSILNCSYSMSSCPRQSSLGYASVSCHNGSLPTGLTIALDGGSLENQNLTGRAVVYKNGIRGRICASLWDDVDASVFCRQLSSIYSGGVSYQYMRQGKGPIWLSNVQCKGNETSIFQCSNTTGNCPRNRKASGDAGVLCYKHKQVPRLRLSGGNSTTGRVEIVYDSEIGSICVRLYASYHISNTVCKQMGFAGGTVVRGFQNWSIQPFMSYVYCYGYESSVFRCLNSGWRVLQKCNRQLAVQCYKNVRLIGGLVTHNLAYGQVQMLIRKTWRKACCRSFGQEEASVVCRELGYNFSKIIPPMRMRQSFFFSYRPIVGFNCSGLENSLLKCKFNSWLKGCSANDSVGASIVCSTTRFTTDIYVSLDQNDTSVVIIKKYGINGGICSNGWDDNDASVLCRQMGFENGSALGPLYTGYSFTTPLFLTDVNCKGTENNIVHCPYNSGVSSRCLSSGDNRARVVCFKSSEGLKIKLTGGPTNNQGIVNIGFNNQWGTICSAQSPFATTNVICRQLGFLGGNVARKTSNNYTSSGFSLLYDPKCTGTESTIWSCPNGGFNKSTSSCKSNKYDVHVNCEGMVKLSPYKEYGAVQVYIPSRRSYVKVCSDEFDDKDATVVCKELGKQYGKSMCCSSFGYIRGDIGITKVQCSGRELSIKKCSSETSLTYCSSRNYASVVCSDVSPTSGLQVKIGYSESSSRGAVQVRYMGQWGYICSRGFDNNDARVVCKMEGFNDGFYYNQAASYRDKRSLRWLSNINCNGTESTLKDCSNLIWGRLQNCSIYYHAAVYCHQTTGLQLRLKGKHSSTGHGRVEIAVNGVWGRLCVSYKHFSRFLVNADVICRQMNYTSGRYVSLSVGGTGPIYINKMFCQGTESTINECNISWGTTYHCRSMNVECFRSVQIDGFHKRLEYGQVKMRVNRKWTAVCDDGFDDTAAGVVCRQIGFIDGIHQCCSGLGKSKTPINVTVTKCTGSERRLEDCSLKYGSCPTGRYVSVYCSYKRMVPSDLQIKFEFSSGNNGTILGNKYGFYGPICSKGWTDADANVACKQLGMVGGVAMFARTGSLNPVVTADFSCTGKEHKLENCPQDRTGFRGCLSAITSGRAAGIRCYNSGGTGIRLLGGGKSYGRLELKFGNTWGRVCNWLWDNNDATVACKQLGFHSGFARRGNYSNGMVSENILITRSSCDGTEESLYQCRSWWIPPIKTTHCADAGVICHNTIRLINGNYISTGSIGVNINGIWGTVCDHNWSDKNTAVACKELGYDNGVSACCSAYGNQPIAIMENVQCRGSESRLVDCSHGDPQTHSCFQHSVAVICFNGKKSKAFNWNLGGGNNYTGEVIINYVGTPGRICSDDWDDNDARVACRELGYRNGTAYNHVRFDYYYSSNGPYWISKLACNGSEGHLAECNMSIPLGGVTRCSSMKSAGIFCSDNVGIYYRIAGGPQENIGRVEVSVNGEWGSICGYNFDDREADVFCRSLGYSAGRVQRVNYLNPTGPTFSTSFACRGDEANLSECPHRGWKKASHFYCLKHRRDAGVACYGKVRLATGFPPKSKDGPVEYYANNQWNMVCDVGFTDISASRVCRDLGFRDGKAICCSAFGPIHAQNNEHILANTSMICHGTETHSLNCVKHQRCVSNAYASVACFSVSDVIDEGYKFSLHKGSTNSGSIDVFHYGKRGYICDTFWDDEDAKVFCKMNGFTDGVAFHSPEMTTMVLYPRPYWMSAIKCTGTEPSLVNCAFNDRLNLGNCSAAHLASAICFKGDSNIKYRLAGGPNNKQGRVEISVGGIWGTICDLYWDNREAGVICRQLGFSDGYAVSNDAYGGGSGPIWLSKMRCDGSESDLHKCPHGGFSHETVSSVRSYFIFIPCKTHIDDAAVYCIDELRLNQGLNASMGAVEIYEKGGWKAVCDDGFGPKDALVVCKTLHFKYGIYLPGSIFGVTEGPINVFNVSCKRNEANFSACQKELLTSTACSSGTYASVYCSKQPIVDKGFELKMELDSASSSSGMLKVTIAGVEGGVCATGTDDKVANVACNELGFAGGVLYNTPNTNKLPILMSDVKCSGSEKSLNKCYFTSKSRMKWCDFYAPRVGVICSKIRDGLNYRLVEGSDKQRGRVEFRYDGVWGSFCDVAVNQKIARVACGTLGYVDGIRMSGIKYQTDDNTPFWFTRLNCFGNETTLLTCTNDGFNNKENQQNIFARACRSTTGPLAVSCFSSKLRITNVRLSGGGDNYGRVEVYLEGPNLWGTVCDQYWSDDDASVVCRQIGFNTGIAVTSAKFGQGTGPIWLQNVGCSGNEHSFNECSHNGYSAHNCSHRNDAGVICKGIDARLNKTTPKVVHVNSSINKIVAHSSINFGISVGVPFFIIFLLAGIGFAIFVIYKRRKQASEMNESLVGNESSETTVVFSGLAEFFDRLKPKSSHPASQSFDVKNPVYNISINSPQN